MRADLQGQVALVGGDDTEVGREIARRFAADGARVATGMSPDEARRRFGRVDIVVDCSPLAQTGRAQALADSAGEELAPTAAARLMAEAAALMRAQGSGRIVSVIGIGASVTRRRDGVRAACTAALASLTRTAAMELAGYGVLVNAVAVGPDAGALSHVPIGRTPTAGAVANAVLFLAAPASSYVTGHVLVVDGGFSAGYVRNF